MTQYATPQYPKLLGVPGKMLPAVGPNGPTGPTGPLGPTGAGGPTGPAATPTFGTGAPSTLVAEGAIYFDTTGSPYVQYVQHTGAWHAA